MSQRKSRAFTPGLVDALEGRVVLSGFKFPVAIGPAVALGYSGKFVLTSNTYEQVQRTLDKSLKAFQNDFARAFRRAGGFGDALDAALGTTVGGLAGLGPGQYTRGMLGKIDRIMAQAEGRLPFGRGLAGVTGGVGLSTFTAATSTANETGLSVAELLDSALNSGGGLFTYAEARQAIESVRQTTLNIVGRAPLAAQVPGILPNYVAIFGPAGNGAFGLRNS